MSASARAEALQMAWSELLTIVGSALGGGLGVQALQLWAARRKNQAQQTQQMAEQAFEEGGRLRTMLLEEVVSVRKELAATVERAHQCELARVRMEAQTDPLRELIEQLRGEIERRDAYILARTGTSYPVRRSGEGTA